MGRAMVLPSTAILLVLFCVACKRELDIRLSSEEIAEIKVKKDPLRLHFRETADLGQGLRVTKKEFHHFNEKGRTKIDILYPQVLGSGDTRIVKFNQQVKALAFQYARYHLNVPPEDARRFRRLTQGDPPDEYPNVDITYSIELVTAEVLSVAFHQYEYSGGAHPGQSYFTINFDLKRKKVIQLPELFKRDTKYLERMVEYCNKALLEHTDYAPMGLTAELKNFTAWHLTKDSFCIDFDRCEFLPCAPGEQIVAIPYADLKDLLNLDGVLKSVVSQ